jgi:hypothetical protein
VCVCVGESFEFFEVGSDVHDFVVVVVVECATHTCLYRVFDIHQKWLRKR